MSNFITIILQSLVYVPFLLEKNLERQKLNTNKWKLYVPNLALKMNYRWFKNVIYLSLLNIRCLYVCVIEYGVFWNVGVGAFNVKTENCFEYNL